MTSFAWTSARIAEALGLDWSDRESIDYAGVSTDSRALRPGELFVALKGERYDGADFVEDALAAGAKGVVLETELEGVPDELDQFVVADSLEALGLLANARRRAIDPTIVAVTGTSGKTTTRSLIAAALGPEAEESPGNFNNLVGMPLSMLGAAAEARVWVLELASNTHGEIARLGRIAEPDIGVVTSIGEGHLEGLGDIEGVLAEKASLLDTVALGGSAFVADEPEELAAEARARIEDVTTVGLGREADVHPDSWSTSEGGVTWSWRGAEYDLPGFGTHLIKGGLMAASIAQRLGVAPGDSATRMTNVAIPPMRGEIRSVDGLTLLVDCYNANPSSFDAALESLAEIAGPKRRVVFASSMLELGERSAELHARVGERIIESGVDIVVATGEFKPALAGSAAELGERLILADDIDAAYDLLSGRLTGDEVVLLKASRGMKLERVIPRFERDHAGGPDGDGRGSAS